MERSQSVGTTRPTPEAIAAAGAAQERLRAQVAVAGREWDREVVSAVWLKLWLAQRRLVIATLFGSHAALYTHRLLTYLTTEAFPKAGEEWLRSSIRAVEVYLRVQYGVYGPPAEEGGATLLSGE